MRRLVLRMGWTALAGLIASATPARAASIYSVQNASDANSVLYLRCKISITCPLPAKIMETLRRAVAGDREAQLQVGRRLDTGDGMPLDPPTAVEWYAAAAERGSTRAALELNRHRHIDDLTGNANDARIAAAMRRAADAGDLNGARALADMLIYGRGAPADPAQALAFLQRASAAGSPGAEQDLAELLLAGAPGIAANTAQGFRWMEQAARHGNAEAMSALGHLLLNHPDTNTHNPVKAYRWLMRAALLDQARAQETLATVLADGLKVGAIMVVQPDPIQADKFLRLAGRPPGRDNPSLRQHIERTMAPGDIEAAKRLVTTWMPATAKDVLAMAMDPP